MLTNIIAAFILGIVEGFTEFIPVSSTGHLILAGYLLKFEGPRASTFEIFIQLGAILAVVILFWDRFIHLFDFRRKEGFAGLRGLGLLILTTIPALAAGALGYSAIKERLFSPFTVAIGLAVGGVAILLFERLFAARKNRILRHGLDTLTWLDALVVGLAQILALWPGVSRSAATMLAGMSMGLDRLTAAEYSFFAAVPALAAASGYDLFKSLPSLQLSDGLIFVVGFVVAFLAAWFAIRFFLNLLSKWTLIPFGWYRIIVAVVVLILL